LAATGTLRRIVNQDTPEMKVCPYGFRRLDPSGEALGTSGGLQNCPYSNQPHRA
jgi:hypothetical protein